MIYKPAIDIPAYLERLDCGRQCILHIRQDGFILRPVQQALEKAAESWAALQLADTLLEFFDRA